MKKTNARWTINKLLENINIIDFPEYQREPTVWNLEKKQRLIDSIVRGFDIASIYFYKKEDGTYDCIDGRQRINAILSFLGENKTDKDNKFPLIMANEIFDDLVQFREIDNKRFEDLNNPPWKDKIRGYEINIVEIEDVKPEEELNLLFLRLQLGQILNAGEKLHAMTGEMRDFIFEDLGKHSFFEGLAIPYRRYARQQVAAQITLNYFSQKKTGKFHRSRYLDLQEFFKEQSKSGVRDKEFTQEIKQVLDKLCAYFGDRLGIIRNRAIAVSIFFFVKELVDQGKEEEIESFLQFLIKFMATLKWQVPLAVRMHPAYHYLLDFQTYVTQAAGEEYAIRYRHEFLRDNFVYFKRENIIRGDKEYKEDTGKSADSQRETVRL